MPIPSNFRLSSPHPVSTVSQIMRIHSLSGRHVPFLLPMITATALAILITEVSKEVFVALGLDNHSSQMASALLATACIIILSPTGYTGLVSLSLLTAYKMYRLRAQSNEQPLPVASGSNPNHLINREEEGKIANHPPSDQLAKPCKKDLTIDKHSKEIEEFSKKIQDLEQRNRTLESLVQDAASQYQSRYSFRRTRSDASILKPKPPPRRTPERKAELIASLEKEFQEFSSVRQLTGPQKRRKAEIEQQLTSLRKDDPIPPLPPQPPQPPPQ